MLAAWSGRGDNLEPQHIAVKLNGRGHVENLQQRRHPLYANGHGILPLHAIALAVHGKASLDAGAKNCGARAAGGGLKKIEGGGTRVCVATTSRGHKLCAANHSLTICCGRDEQKPSTHTDSWGTHPCFPCFTSSSIITRHALSPLSPEAPFPA